MSGPSVHGRDHPRIRGEHFTLISMLLLSAGSSPHTRGARRELYTAPFIWGIIPAYAGSTKGHKMGYIYARDHPRIRGEHYCLMAQLYAPSGSSPHTRGAHIKLKTNFA